MSKKMIVSTCLFFLASSPCFARLPYWLFNPNLGVDFLLRSQTFDNRFGQQHFREGYPVNNFFVGTRVNRCYGIELGYTQTYSQQKIESYNGNQAALGFFNRSFSSTQEVNYISNLSEQGWNANLLGYYPICPKLKTELTSLVGVSFAKMLFNTVPIFDAFPSPAAPVERWSSSRKPILRLGLGLQQMVTNHFGVRAQALWEDTARLKTTIPVSHAQGGLLNPSQSTDFYTVKPQGSYLFGVGFFLVA